MTTEIQTTQTIPKTFSSAFTRGGFMKFVGLHWLIKYTRFFSLHVFSIILYNQCDSMTNNTISEIYIHIIYVYIYIYPLYNVMPIP